MVHLLDTRELKARSRAAALASASPRASARLIGIRTRSAQAVDRLTWCSPRSGVRRSVCSSTGPPRWC